MSKVIVISVKPEFAHRIFEGSKKIELRKSSPKVDSGDIVIIYSTFPEKAVIGICKIKEVIKSTPDEIWIKHSNDLGIDKDRFFQYYSGRDKAVGIMIDCVRKFKNKMSLKEIKEHIPTFSPPQTFKYYNRRLLMDSMNVIKGSY